MRNRFLAVAVLAVSARAALAQDSESRRSGITAAFGAGIGSAGITCSPQCQGDRKSGPTGLLRIGGNITPNFTMAAEANFFVNKVRTSAGEGTWAFTWITLTSLWYPSEDDDWFVKLGLGISKLRAETPLRNFGNDRLDTSDVGLVAGIGQDIRFSGRLSLTPYLDYMFSPRSNAVINKADAGLKMSGDVIYVGLALTIP